MRHFWMLSRKFLTSFLVIFVVGIGGLSAGEVLVPPQQHNKTNLSATFFGSSTFLFEDNESQILIDGFFTRKNHNYWREMSPDLNHIMTAVRRTGICIAPYVSPTQRYNCRDGKTLKLIVPAHGHYDHALDVGVLAIWSDAPIVADTSIKSVISATEQLDLSELGLSKPYETEIADTYGRDIVVPDVDVGDFEIKLIRSRHISNFVTRLIGGTTAGNLAFPAMFHEFREGTNYSIWIKHNGTRILVVPTAGVANNVSIAYKELGADVVMLGVGGLGLKSQRQIEGYWSDVVEASGAKRVFLIHWDSDQYEFDYDSPSFVPARPKLLERVVKIFTVEAKADVAINVPDPLRKFNP